MKMRIHVNQHNIKHNRKHDGQKPVLTCKTYKSNRYADEAIIRMNGTEIGRVVYRPENPMSCGAEVWIELDLNLVEIEFHNRDPEQQLENLLEALKNGKIQTRMNGISDIKLS